MIEKNNIILKNVTLISMLIYISIIYFYMYKCAIKIRLTYFYFLLYQKKINKKLKKDGIFVKRAYICFVI